MKRRFESTGIFLFASLASTLLWQTDEFRGANPGASWTVSAAHTLASPAVVIGASPDPVRVSLAFGISVALVSLCLRSGGGVHLNPAVTLALLAGLRVSPLRAVLYVLSQLGGALMASAVLLGVTPEAIRGKTGINELSPGVCEYQALCVEMFVTFQFVLCVFATLDPKSALHKLAPLAIGLAVTLGHLVAIGFTGCSMNPARSFGPAAVTVNFRSHWVFWAGPCGGAVLACLMHDLILFPRWGGRKEWLLEMRASCLRDSRPQPGTRETE
nr:PREDICTED: aquaporin-1-like isoform X1 [Lepisosteus oculatus]